MTLLVIGVFVGWTLGICLAMLVISLWERR
jgi:hypothetical protein